ncbi:MAG: hypothetical protein IKQ27_00055 [Lachnospiraceae bacterium]|nr:hypothetical protein [Lachnospiraceae bacterium]
MKVLYVTGSCLTKNTSANMSHNGYVQGLLENGAEVDIIMAQDSWGEADPAFSQWEKAKYYVYNSVSLKDKIRKTGRKGFQAASVSDTKDAVNNHRNAKKKSINLRSIAKKLFYKLFPNDPLYPLEEKWLKTAARFKSETKYDLVISNSSPAASHKLVSILKKKRAIQYKQWVQIWEDPWFYDLYGGHTEAQKVEEHALLRDADKIYYVSPLTLMYQKKYFADCADKMDFIPLPAFEFASEDSSKWLPGSYGYFGDYYSQTRNLEPFYEAARQKDAEAYIIGDTNLKLETTDKIHVMPRITLDELSKYQEQTHVLVNLCNLKGGQIPGKIYHYSVTRHPILFILDGTEEEKKQIYSYFSKLERYVFCENTVESISEAIETINRNENKEESPAECFYPKNIISQLLKETI